MTLLDVLLIVVIALFVVRGFFRGFLLELFDVVSLVAGYLAARFFGPPVGDWLADVTALSRWWAGVIAAIVLFLMIAALVRLLAHFLRKVIRAIKLGGLDRGLGSFLGAAKALLIILALFFLAILSPWSKSVVEYSMEGVISRYIVFGSQLIRDSIGAEPVAPTQSLAKWLRAAGVPEDAVLTIVDQPDLFLEVLKQARNKDLTVPVEEIEEGEPSIKLPDKITLSDEQKREIVDMLERAGLTAKEKAQRLWEMLMNARPEAEEL